MNVITKLAIRSLNAHRIRSAVICTAVILTTVLFMTVFSITFDIFSSTQLSLMMAGGSDLHSSISHRDIDLSAEELHPLKFKIIRPIRIAMQSPIMVISFVLYCL